MKSNLFKATIATVLPGLISVAAFAAPTTVKTIEPKVDVKPFAPLVGAPAKKAGSLPTAGQIKSVVDAQKKSGAVTVAPEQKANDNSKAEAKSEVTCSAGSLAAKVAEGTGFSSNDVESLIDDKLLNADKAACNAQVSTLPTAAKRNLLSMLVIARNQGVKQIKVEDVSARNEVYASALERALAENDNARVSHNEALERVQQIRSHCGYIQ